MARKHRRGHYCWACDRRMANERFSGRGHARHVCKECARLGKKELDYLQGVRNLERLLRWNCFIPRKKRQQFNKFLEHPNERVRELALQIEAEDALARAESRLARDLDEVFCEMAMEGVSPLSLDPEDDLDMQADSNAIGVQCDSDIPF